jgi:hypothetical protein
MMAISRKPLEKKNDDDNMFSAPTAQLFDDVDNEEGKNEVVDDKYDALAKQIAELQRANDEIQRANMALLNNPNFGREQEFQPQLDDPDKIELPDPALDPDGFSKANLRRIEVVNANQRKLRDAEDRKNKTVQEKADALEKAFAEKYPELAQDKERLDYISIKVAQDAQKRGLDVQRYMFLTQDKFLDDVAKRYVKVFGEPEPLEDDDLDFDYEENRSSNLRAAPRTRGRPRARSRNRSEDDGMVSRTAGIFGGNESGGRPGRGRDDDKGPDMIDDIHAIQRKTGFF